MKRWRTRIAALVPAPLAAPETIQLRRQRYAVLGAFGLLGCVSLFWQGLVITLGILASALLSGIIVFLLVLGPLWLLAKWRADEAWNVQQAGRAEPAEGREHDDA